MARRLTMQEKVELVRLVGDNARSFRQAADEFNLRHPGRQPPIRHKLVATINKNFDNRGIVCKLRPKNYNLQNRQNQNEERILQYFREHPRYSIRQVALNLNFNKNIVWRCLKKHRKRAFKPKFLHTLEDGDTDRRLDFCFWAQGEFLNNVNFLKNVIFTDEATFTTNGVVCSQNCRFWADENPHWIISTKRQYVSKVNVWCGLWNDQIIGPFFIPRLNGETYLNLLQREIQPFLNNLPQDVRRDLYYQLDGAPAHNVARGWLEDNFPGRWIGLRSQVHEFPPRSPDLTPLDFYLWGRLKNIVYKNRPRSQDELMIRIRQACLEITPAEIRKVIRHVRKRIEQCIRNDGGYIETQRII